MLKRFKGYKGLVFLGVSHGGKEKITYIAYAHTLLHRLRDASTELSPVTPCA